MQRTMGQSYVRQPVRTGTYRKVEKLVKSLDDLKNEANNYAMELRQTNTRIMEIDVTTKAISEEKKRLVDIAKRYSFLLDGISAELDKRSQASMF